MRFIAFELYRSFIHKCSMLLIVIEIVFDMILEHQSRFIKRTNYKYRLYEWMRDIVVSRNIIFFDYSSFFMA